MQNDFAYKPAEEQEKAMELERIKLQMKARKARLMHQSSKKSMNTEDSKYSDAVSLSVSSSNKYFDDEGNLLKNIPKLHTNLTTFNAVKLFRNNLKTLVTVYIKIMPAGAVTKLIVDSSDSVFSLYNMFCSHNSYGSAKSSMIVLPTFAGIFELNREIAQESDLLIADNRGREKLENFGFNLHRGVVVLLFFANYQRFYISSLLRSYFEKNIDFSLSDLPVMDYLVKLPKSIFQDTVQKYLRKIIEDEYRLQQEHLIEGFKQLGIEYRKSREAEIEKAVQRRKMEAMMLEKDLISSTIRLEAHLKGFATDEEKLAAFKALKEREMKKRRGALFREGDSASDASPMIRSLLESSSRSSSSQVSLSDVNFEEDKELSESDGSDNEGDTSTNSSSSNDSGDSDSDSDSDRLSPRLTARSRSASSVVSTQDVHLESLESSPSGKRSLLVNTLSLPTPAETELTQAVAEIAIASGRSQSTVFHVSQHPDEKPVVIGRTEIQNLSNDRNSVLSNSISQSSYSIVTTDSRTAEDGSSLPSSTSESQTSAPSVRSSYFDDTRVAHLPIFDNQSQGTIYSQYTERSESDSESARSYLSSRDASSEPWTTSRTYLSSRPSSTSSGSTYFSSEYSANSSRTSSSNQSPIVSSRTDYSSINSDGSESAPTSSRTINSAFSSRYSSYTSRSSSTSASAEEGLTTGRSDFSASQQSMTSRSASTYSTSRPGSNFSASSYSFRSDGTETSRTTSSASFLPTSRYSTALSTARSYYTSSSADSSSPLSTSRYSAISDESEFFSDYTPYTARTDGSEYEPMAEGDFLQYNLEEEEDELDGEVDAVKSEQRNKLIGGAANNLSSTLDSNYSGYGYIDSKVDTAVNPSASLTTHFTGYGYIDVNNEDSVPHVPNMNSQFSGYGYIERADDAAVAPADETSSQSAYSMSSKGSRARRKLKSLLATSASLTTPLTVLPATAAAKNSGSIAKSVYDNNSVTSASTLPSNASQSSTSYSETGTKRVRKPGSVVSATSSATSKSGNYYCYFLAH